MRESRLTHRSSQEDLSPLLVPQPARPIPVGVVIAAIFTALRTAFVYRRDGFEAAAHRLSRTPVLRRRRSWLEEPVEAMEPFLARQLSRQVRGAIRTASGMRRCLFESVGIAAGLRRCGLPAQVVVGYEIAGASQDTPVHAWVALGATPVSDDVSVAHRFGEVVRYPEDVGWR
jgi:hypothetical protein